MLEGLTTCVGYSDFLAETAPFNSKLLDRWVVVTDPSDSKTAAVAESFGAKVVLSERHKAPAAPSAGGSVFNRGALVNDGAAALEFADWVLILDADIVLPPEMRGLPLDSLDRKAVYGVSRRMCGTWKGWQDVLNGADPRKLPVATHATICRNGTRKRVLTPIGFFQMFHVEAVAGDRRLYSEDFPTAAKSDIVFSDRWPLERQKVLPLASLPIHLGPARTNWTGRVSPWFGPG